MNIALVEHYHMKRGLQLINIYMYIYILHPQYNSILESDTIAVLLAGVLHEKWA